MRDYIKGDVWEGDVVDMEESKPYYVTNPPRTHVLKEMPVTLIIILANIIAGIFCLASGKEDYYLTGGINYEYMQQNGEYIRAVTYMFLHANFPHLANNMLVLFIVGHSVEPIYGSLKMAIIYFGSGIGAGFISAGVSHMLHPDIMRYGAGASGTVFGVMCAQLFLMFLEKKQDANDAAKKAVVLIIIYAIISNKANVDVLGHLSGGILGGLLALILSKTHMMRNEEKLPGKISGMLVALAISIAGISFAGIGKAPAQLNDRRIDEVKAITIYKGYDITFGDCFGNLEDARWIVFTSDKNEQMVEFNGYTYYDDKRQALRVQFKFTEDKGWLVSYAGLDGHGLSGKEFNELLNYLAGF